MKSKVKTEASCWRRPMKSKVKAEAEVRLDEVRLSRDCQKNENKPESDRGTI
jgi:hypothetical protein